MIFASGDGGNRVAPIDSSSRGTVELLNHFDIDAMKREIAERQAIVARIKDNIGSQIP